MCVCVCVSVHRKAMKRDRVTLTDLSSGVVAPASSESTTSATGVRRSGSSLSACGCVYELQIWCAVN